MDIKQPNRSRQVAHGKLQRIFACACVGLLGLSAFVANCRADLNENFDKAACEGKIETEVKPQETPGWGPWDTNLNNSGGFAGTVGDPPATFTVTSQVVKDQGRSGKPGDNAASMKIEASFKGGGYAGLVLHGGESSTGVLSEISASAWFKAPAGMPFLMFVEAGGKYENRVEFTAIGTGEWQHVGGALTTVKDINLAAALKADPKATLDVVFEVGSAEWTDGQPHELLVDDVTLTSAKSGLKK